MLNIIRDNAPQKIAEIGVWRGRLSKMILEFPCVKELTLIDPWKASLNDFSYEGKSYKCNMGEKIDISQNALDKIYEEVVTTLGKDDRVNIMRECSVSAASSFSDKYFDLVFIDAIHLYEFVKEDINSWLPKVKVGGILAGDDYKREGVKRAVDEIFPNRELSNKNQAWWIRIS